MKSLHVKIYNEPGFYMTITDRILTTIGSERKLVEVDPGNNRDYFV